MFSDRHLELTLRSSGRRVRAALLARARPHLGGSPGCTRRQTDYHHVPSPHLSLCTASQPSQLFFLLNINFAQFSVYYPHQPEYSDQYADALLPDPQFEKSAPPPYQAPPPSGFRIPLSTESVLPPAQQLGPPVCYDADGHSPIYIGSAIFPNAVHPCKIGPHLSPPCRVPYGGGEHEHRGRYDLLPFDPNSMEWVRTSRGQIPPGRRPVEGGYEQGGGKLYHAMANVQGTRVPGKTGEHLGGCNYAFGGTEHVEHDNYEILCWK